MGCEMSSCKNICNKNNRLDQHELLDPYYGASTNREVSSNTQRSDLSDHIFFNLELKENSKIKNLKSKFDLDLEKIKNININKPSPISESSLRSNNSRLNASENYDGVDCQTQRRQGKPFIYLMKEFNLINKLFRKSNSIEKSNIDINMFKCNSPRNVESSIDSSNNSNIISVNSNLTLNNTINSNFSAYKLKSSIIKKNKSVSSSKDYLNKLKNLIYIPIISTTGDVINSFAIRREGDKNYNANSSNNKCFNIEYYSITTGYNPIFADYLINFIQSLEEMIVNNKSKSNSSDSAYDFEKFLMLINSKKQNYVSTKFTFSFKNLNKESNIFSLSILNVNETLLLSFIKNFCHEKKFNNLINGISGQLSEKKIEIKEIGINYIITGNKDLISQPKNKMINALSYILSFSLNQKFNILEMIVNIIKKYNNQFESPINYFESIINQNFESIREIFIEIEMESLLINIGVKKVITNTTDTNKNLKFEIIRMKNNSEISYYIENIL